MVSEPLPRRMLSTPNALLRPVILCAHIWAWCEISVSGGGGLRGGCGPSGEVRRGGAVGAGAENFDGVGDVDEAVFAARSGGPAFDSKSFHLDGGAAPAAYQVVVVFVGSAAAVADLAVLTSQGIKLAGFGEGPHLVVHSGEGDVFAVGLE